RGADSGTFLQSGAGGCPDGRPKSAPGKRGQINRLELLETEAQRKHALRSGGLAGEQGVKKSTGNRRETVLPAPRLRMSVGSRFRLVWTIDPGEFPADD